MDSWKDDQNDEEEDDNVREGYGGKDALIFLIDVHTPTMIESSNGEDSPLQKALKCVHATLRRKIFENPNDVVGVVLMGTEKNHGIRDFEHLSLLLPLDTPEKKHIQDIEDFVLDDVLLAEKTGKLGTSKFALHHALWQFQSLFNEIKGKSDKKRIIFFTSNDHPHENNEVLERQARIKANDLQENGLIFEVIPMTIEQNFDWQKFYIDLVTKDETEDSTTLAQENNCKQTLEDLFNIVRRKVYKKRSIGRCYLDMGNGVKMAVASYNFVQKASKPTKVRLARDTNEEVRVQRTFIDRSSGAPLLPSDVCKFMEYGRTRIKFTQDEIRGMRKAPMDGQYGLRLLAFKSRESFDVATSYVRSSHFLYPAEENMKGSRNIFAALHNRCLARQVYAICAYKAREASIPFIVALHPQKEERDPDGGQRCPPGFLMFYLPFSDDHRDIPKSRPSIEVSEEQMAIAKKVGKKLKMKFYDHRAFENPSLQGHFRMIESLALLKEDEEDDGADLTLPPVELQRKRLGNLSEEFNRVVAPTEELEQEVQAATSKKRKPYQKMAASVPSKRPKMLVDTSLINEQINHLVDKKQVETLKVKELKDFLKGVGCPVWNKTKAKLVQDVYDHFKFH